MKFNTALLYTSIIFRKLSALKKIKMLKVTIRHEIRHWPTLHNINHISRIVYCTKQCLKFDSGHSFLFRPTSALQIVSWNWLGGGKLSLSWLSWRFPSGYNNYCYFLFLQVHDCGSQVGVLALTQRISVCSGVGSKFVDIFLRLFLFVRKICKLELQLFPTNISPL